MISFMISLKKFSPSVVAFFGEKGVALDECLMSCESDLGTDGVSKNVYAVITKEKIAVAEGFIGFEGKAKASARTEIFTCTAYREFLLEKCEDVRVELFISGGRAVCEYEGETAEIARFTFACRHDVNILCDIANQLKKDGKIDEEKLKHENEDEHFCPKCHRRYPDQDRKICPKCMEKAKLVKRLLKMFVRYKYYIMLILLTFALVAGLRVITPYVSNKMFISDVLTPGGSMYGEIGKILLMIVGVRLISLLISIVNGIISAKVAADVV